MLPSGGALCGPKYRPVSEAYLAKLRRVSLDCLDWVIRLSQVYGRKRQPCSTEQIWEEMQSFHVRIWLQYER
jgi:hypothetical protein